MNTCELRCSGLLCSK